MSQKSRRRLLGEFTAAFGTAATISFSGCLGFGNGESEPEQLPRGLTERGIELDVLRERMINNVEEADFHVVGVVNEYRDVEDEPTEFQRTRLRIAKMNDWSADTENNISIRTDGSLNEEVESIRSEQWDESYDPVNFEEFAPSISIVVNDEEHVRDQDGEVTVGPYEPRRGLRPTVTERWMPYAFERIEEVIWNPPEWDEDLGVYTLTDDTTTSDFEANEAELHVNSDGVPVHVSGDIPRAPGRVLRAEAVFIPESVDISVPDWVENS